MRGSVGYEKARRTWWYLHDLPRTATGKRRQARKRGFATRRDAEGALDASIWNAAQAGPAPPDLSVAAYLSRRLDARAVTLAPATLARYRRPWVRGSATRAP